MTAVKKHQSEYPVHLGGLKVNVVEAGTEIEDVLTKQRQTVTDQNAVCHGSIMWCTQTVYEALAARIKSD